MRTHILTSKERRIVKVYLKGGKKSSGTRTLLHRTKRFLPKLKEELKLLEAINKKMKKTSSKSGKHKGKRSKRRKRQV